MSNRMYKSKTFKRNIIAFKIANNKLLVKGRGNVLTLEDEYLNKDVYDFFVLGNLFTYNLNNQGIMQKTDKSFIKVTPRLFLNFTFTDNTNLCLLTDKETNNKLFANNLELSNEKLLLNNYDWEFLYLNHSNLYLYTSQYLKSLSLIVNEYEWEANLSEYCRYEGWQQEGKRLVHEGSITKVIGEYNGMLWLICSQRRLLGLSLKTGLVNVNLLLSNLHNDLFANEPYLDVIAGELSFLEYRYYYVIDLNTLQLKVVHRLPFTDIRDVVEMKTFQGSYVYFTCIVHHSEKESYIYIGVFNRCTLQIDWLENLNLKESWVNQPPQVGANKLYILDTSGTLHIFERES